MSRLTVIIPTWNQKALLGTCLGSIEKQTAPCQVLIVDNGSTDSTSEMIKQFSASSSLPVQYMNLGMNLGFARAVNAGIKAAGADFVALLNNDTEADRRWVEMGLRAFEEYPDYDFFASKIINYHHRHLLDSAGDCYNRQGIAYKRGFGESVEKFTELEPVLGAGAAAGFYRRSLFEDIGLFDADFFMYLEDVDLSLRAQRAGHRCLYLPGAIVYHIEAASDPGPLPHEGVAKAPQGHKKIAQGVSPGLVTLKQGSPGGAKGRLCRPWGAFATPSHGRGSEYSPLAGARGSEFPYPSRDREGAATSNVEPNERSVGPHHSATRTYWITRNRWQLMVTYQPLRHLPWLIYGWTRSALFYLFKAGFFGAFLRGLWAGVRCTPRALRKRRALMARTRVDVFRGRSNHPR